MHAFNLALVWLFVISSSLQVQYTSTSLSNREPSDVDKFFENLQKMMDSEYGLESKSEDPTQKSDVRKLRYLLPETVARVKVKGIFDSLGNAVNSLSSNRNGPFYSSNDVNGMNTVGGYQEFVFRPLYSCDSYDSAQRHCILRRQLGTTLTLGVQVEGLHGGMQVHWYRCIRKKDLHHVIQEPLNKEFLPWNLNLGGLNNELRISPISEIDLSSNYFVAELVTADGIHKSNNKKASIRFDIEPIEIDMGTLYAGEEIVIYARAFTELPRTSVNFLWSLQGKNDFEDHGLPSNMQLNADRSSVIIKELNTYQDKYLVCKVYSNKDFLLTKRTFLFRGFGRNKINTASRNVRFKRYVEDNEQPFRESNQMQYEETGDKSYTAEKDADSFAESDINIHDVPEIAADPFYDNSNSKKYSHKVEDSNYRPLRSQNAMSRIMRRFIEKDESIINKLYGTKEPPLHEKFRFEDIESQMIATCRTDSDCNIRATCIRESNYGQNYCKCSHGFNGNGLFCFSS